MQPANARPCLPSPRTKPAPHHLRRLRVPAETVLTPAVLVGAARRLPDADLESDGDI